MVLGLRRLQCPGCMLHLPPCLIGQSASKSTHSSALRAAADVGLRRLELQSVLSQEDANRLAQTGPVQTKTRFTPGPGVEGHVIIRCGGGRLTRLAGGIGSESTTVQVRSLDPRVEGYSMLLNQGHRPLSLQLCVILVGVCRMWL